VTSPTQTANAAARIYEFEVYAPGGSTNLALNKPATSSSVCVSTEGPEKAVNGSVSGGNSDKWCGAITDTDKWLQVDLGSAQSLGKIVIKHAATGGEPAAMNTREYAVETSTDGSTWTQMVNVSGDSRLTTTTYDSADRVTSVSIMDDTASVAMPRVDTVYDPVTSKVTQTKWTTTVGAQNVTVTIARAYDITGRVISYTDADGSITTSEYDRYGRPSKTTDPHGTRTYAYDRALEPRGMLTSLTDSVAGTFGPAYSPDGQLTTVTYPSGMTRTDRLDSGLKPVQRTYTRDSDGQVIFDESAVTNSAGQVVSWVGTTGSRTYGYDGLGRLTTVADTAAGLGCVTRAYVYDTRANRQSKTTYGPDADGACQTDTADSVEAHTYDAADRLTDAGYTYDSWGRTTATATGNAFTYYADDLVASQTLGSQRRTWSLDPSLRERTSTTETLVSGAWTNATTKINHYGDDTDEPTWVVEDPTLGTFSRNVSGPDGDLAALTDEQGRVQLQLTNLHGDVAGTIDPSVPNLAGVTFTSYDEFGVASTSQAALRYGWLGGKQRSAETLDGTILMGVRLYSPALGRFLQSDPVDGGSCSAYDYVCADPVNGFDLSGEGWWSSIKKGLNVVAKVASVASMIPGPIGTICGVVSAVAYLATGNWKEAAWAVGGALAATVGMGAAVKGARLAIGAVKAAKAAGKLARLGSKLSRVGSKIANTVRRGCNSFSGDTMVLMADGTYLPIAQIDPGDLVMSADPRTGQETAKPVLNVIVDTGTKHMVDVDLGGGSPLQATAEHPVWVVDRGWTNAGDLHAGDTVVLEGDVPVHVRSVTDRGWRPGQVVYNLTVADLHTYVVDADGHDLLVHNSSCPTSLGKSRGLYIIHLKNGRKYVGITTKQTFSKRVPRHWKRSRGALKREGYSDADISHIQFHPSRSSDRVIQQMECRVIARLGGVGGGILLNRNRGTNC